MPRAFGADRRFPTYRQILIIESIARHRSIGQAADALHLSQPAVTRALQSVEDLFGVRLFDRMPGGVMPTAFVEPILKRSKSIERAMRETERDLEKLSDPQAYRLRIGAGIHSTEIWGNRALASLVIAQPDLKISIENYDWNDLLDDLLIGRIDYGLGEISELMDRTDIAVEPLSDLHLHFICRAQHPLTTIPVPNVEDISGFAMAGNKMARRLALHFRNTIGRLGEYDAETGGIHSAIRVTSLNAIKYILKQSDTIALMPFESVQAEVAAGSLVALSRDAMPWLTGKVGFIAARSRRITPLMTTFRKAVIEVDRQRHRATRGIAPLTI